MSASKLIRELDEGLEPVVEWSLTSSDSAECQDWLGPPLHLQDPLPTVALPDDLAPDQAGCGDQEGAT